MKQTRFSEKQIVVILQQQEGDTTTKEICQEHSSFEATFYNMKSEYGGMEPYDIKLLKELEEENARLKRSGASTEFIQEVLGHTNKKTIENYLDSFEKEVKKEYAAKLTEFKKGEIE